MSGKRLPKKDKRKKKSNGGMKVWAFPEWNVHQREYSPEQIPRPERFWMIKSFFRILFGLFYFLPKIPKNKKMRFLPWAMTEEDLGKRKKEVFEYESS
ncbi:hypothetical protein A2996_00520 [Candidatus Campbellbacteria bacterium RIFCSPLOWO2_01_FULL_34_15]|uniref:Uncharacterized protein n=2 Tax=Candidatus Campbelliibacteriota TaxID=1752727 RepID=A0A1F5EL59_9BACT|nr:MAG: hypothetical protein A2996_00520 [Candidatus Campbellbacteria bacterium RIFCSPLOWO2_01_FULL_34_15]OGD68377.1 MAG: hypothetical protein A2811_01520 [Candidatus Campbellbacteria bacterium RIFCSPHIGHO2_01_FULL_34_10]